MAKRSNSAQIPSRYAVEYEPKKEVMTVTKDGIEVGQLKPWRAGQTPKGSALGAALRKAFKNFVKQQEILR